MTLPAGKTRRSFWRLAIVVSSSLCSYLLGYLNNCANLKHNLTLKLEGSLQKETTKEKIPQQAQIFYNLFLNTSDDEERVRNIVEEQFALVNPTVHGTNVTITSIGHQLQLVDASLGNAT